MLLKLQPIVAWSHSNIMITLSTRHYTGEQKHRPETRHTIVLHRIGLEPVLTSRNQAVVTVTSTLYVRISIQIGGAYHMRMKTVPNTQESTTIDVRHNTHSSLTMKLLDNCAHLPACQPNGLSTHFNSINNSGYRNANMGESIRP